MCFTVDYNFYHFENLLGEIMEIDANQFDSGQGRRFLSYPKGPDRLWDTTILFGVYLRIFSQDKTTWP
jgi:hypothetical protein